LVAEEEKYLADLAEYEIGGAISPFQAWR
jgi:hypothetical protein